MTLLLGVVCLVVAALVWGAVLLALQRLDPVPGSPADTSQRPWDTALRTLAYASPAFGYTQSLADVRLLSDEELCQAWRASYDAVATARSARQLRVAAEDRRSYLDELERRYPLAVSAWLCGTAKADGDPLPYISQGFDDRSPDW